MAIGPVMSAVLGAGAAGAASGAMGLLGGHLDRKFQREQASSAMAFEAQQAQNKMDFEERMSNTAWQRGVEDMEKAGLNPALAYMQGGASSAGGAMAHGQQAHGDGGMQRAFMKSLDVLGNIASTAILVGAANQRHKTSWKYKPIKK